MGVDVERGGHYVIPGTVAQFLDMACYPNCIRVRPNRPRYNFGVYWLMRTVPRVLVNDLRQRSRVPIKGVTYIRGHKDLQDDNQLPIMMFSTGTVACKVFLAVS